jgi:hypothetical protein
MANTFSAQVGDWVKESKARLLAVAQQSSQAVVNDAQTESGKGGNMPVDTGFLRASLVGQLNQSVNAVTFNTGKAKASYAGESVTLAIANMDIGDTFHAGWTANYAYYVEYGANGRAGRAFLRTAAARWPEIVAETVRELRARSG